MWKTITIEVGQKYELDAPNQSAVARIIPLLWLPAQTNKSIVAAMQAGEAKVAKMNEETQADEILTIRMENVYTLVPHFVASWDLVDPATSEIMPTPRQMVERNEVDRVKNLPMQLLNDIVETAMAYGQEDQPVVGTGPDINGDAESDPDKGTMAAQVIPLMSVVPSEAPSSTEAALTPS